MELKPAHEVILTGIKEHCQILGRIRQILSNGAPRISGLGTNVTSEIYFKVCDVKETGCLCGLLETLGKMIIPMDHLDKVIAELREITFNGPEIYETVKMLEQRKPIPIK